MQRLYVVLLCVVATAAVSHVRLLHQEWRTYKLQYKKRYDTIEEDRAHMKAFMESKLAVARHEQLHARGRSAFRLGLNKYADVPRPDFLRTMNGYRMTDLTATGKTFEVGGNMSLAKVPEHVDWRRQGYVTAVKDQEKCASCWAFSATGALEGQLFRKRRRLVSLSEQNLVDCSGAYGNHGCEGGNMDHAFQYVRDVGIDGERTYPYEGLDDTCRYKPNDSITREEGFAYVPSGNEAKLKVAVAIWGPVSAAIDASMHSFHLYRGGVYRDTGCSSTNLNHAVLIVGYGRTKRGGPYWLVKNSWGTSWGERGYVRIARNYGNHCGVATRASYPSV